VSMGTKSGVAILSVCLGMGVCGATAAGQRAHFEGTVISEGGKWRYQIKNLSALPMIAYRVSSHCYGDASDFHGYHDALAIYGIQYQIPPGAVDSFEITEKSAKCDKVTSAATFADETSEGDSAELGAIRDGRQGVLLGLETAKPTVELVAAQGADPSEEASVLDMQQSVLKKQYNLNSSEWLGELYALRVAASLVRGESLYPVPPTSSTAQEHIAKLTSAGVSKNAARAIVIATWLQEWIDVLKKSSR
jgi:hypothetical protein